jgi:adenylate cyclase
MEPGSPSGAQLAETVRRRLRRAAVIANTLGAIDVFLFLAFLVPVSGGRTGNVNIVVNGIAGALYLAFTLWLGTRTAERRLAPVERWLREERPATEAEREITLQVPFFNARISALAWAAAALAFTALNLTQPVAIPAVTCITIILGGLTTAAVSYLMAERIMRPVTARALAGGPPSRPAAPGVRTRLITAWTLATGVPVLGVAAVSVAQLAGSGGDSGTAAGASLFLAGLALFVGLMTLMLAARSIAEPVAAVRDALARVEEGDLEARVPVDDASEVGLLESGFNRMAAGLQERERLRDLFGRHVGEDVARAALEREVRLGGEEREIAALFVDLVGSTTLAARRPPGEVVELLNRFFRAVVETVEARGGFVNKFEGDAALSVFGAPVASENPAADALAAARELSARLRSELPDMDFGIGVSAGVAVAGNVGAEHRYEYTVIGDPVNEAARLCELAKQRPERVLASEAAVERAGAEEAAHWSLGEPIVLRGRDEATRLATMASAEPGVEREVGAGGGERIDVGSR